MRKTSKKVKRPHINWNDVRIDLEDQRVDAVFYRLMTKHPKMSKNRLSWNALKHYYSTTALSRFRWLGEPLNEM